MACKTETTTINGRTYFTVQRPAMQAQLLKLKLIKVLGSSMAKLASAWKADSLPDMANGLGGALDAIFANASPEELLTLQMELLMHVKVDGKVLKSDADFNEVYSGEHLFDMDKAFFWAIGVNFSGLFGESGLKGFQTKMEAGLAKFQTSPSSEQHKDSPQT